jgi:hypothetical protein
MTLTEINAIPRGAEWELGTEVFTPGYGTYFIHCYNKGTRRYFKLTGWYTGKTLFSTSINDDKEEAFKLIKEIAEARIDRYRK